MALAVRKGRGYVYYLRYHVVFCVKYRHTVIEGAVETRLKQMLHVLATARFLFKEYSGLKKKLWGGHLWNPSYFVTTVGDNTEAAVRKYIESQKTRSANRGEDDG